MTKYFLFIFFILFYSKSFGQGINNFSLNGNLVLNAQTFQEDLSIGAEERDPNLTSNLNLLLRYKDYITTGLRFDV